MNRSPETLAETLPDLLREDLDILSIGLNPSPPSVAAGYYFANPRNRFWRALNGSCLVAERLEPGAGAQQRLSEVFGIGFTDVVKRSTPGSKGLRAADFRRDAPRLAALLVRYRPRIAWFHGREAWNGFARHAGDAVVVDRGREAPRFGEQPCTVGTSRVFVTPNPSPANAAFSLDDLVRAYDRLAALRERLATSRRD